MLTAIVLLAVFGGLGFYYFRFYMKGKAAGGGLMEGFAAAERERWAGVLEADEQITIRGAGTEMMPWWKSMVRENFPIARSFIKVISHEFVVTSKNRILMLTTETGQVFGTTLPVKALTLDDIEVTHMEQQKTSGFTQMTANAMGAGEIRTFNVSMKLKSAEKPMELGNVNGDFADFVSSRMRIAQAAA